MSDLVKQLTDGLMVNARKDGSVITIKAADGKATVAEVCVGAKKVRANFRSAPKGALAKKLSGKSKSWPAGGIIVEEANVKSVRAALVQVSQ